MLAEAAPMQSIGSIAARIVANAGAKSGHAKIGRPGFWRIDIETYHGDCCDGPSLSASGINTILQKSPAHYWAGSPLNPDAAPRADTPALAFGKAAHCLLLGEPVFRSAFAVSEYPDFRTKEAREWRDAMQASGRVIVTKDQLASIKAIARQVERNPLALKLLTGGTTEMSMIWRDEETGLWLKSRPDVLHDVGVSADLKTTADITPDALRRSFADYGYAGQGALVRAGWKALTGEAMTNEANALVWVEKDAPHCVAVLTIDPEALMIGDALNRKALRIAAGCIAKGEWPGPTPDPVITFPDWRLKQLRRDLEEGLLS
jgi:hypothetical protein